MARGLGTLDTDSHHSILHDLAGLLYKYKPFSVCFCEHRALESNLNRGKNHFSSWSQMKDHHVGVGAAQQRGHLGIQEA